MNKSRVQRYKLTAEFVIKDRGDYESYKKDIDAFFKSLEGPRFQPDYLALEKVEK